jgi:hypothetical protein
LDGLVWLPLLALGICVGLFPAYGFRPECFPLLVFALVRTIVDIPALASSAASRPNDDFRDRGPLLTMLAIVLLAALALVMVVFSPRTDDGLTVEGVQMRKIRDGTHGRDFVLRVYGPKEAEQPGPEIAADDMEIYALNVPSAGNSGPPPARPVIFLIPPEAGSIAVVDLVCAALRDRGFTVITYSRKGFDSPLVDENGRKQRFASPIRLRASWRVFRQGTALAAVNEQGKVLEAERRADIEFLLPRIPALLDTAPARQPYTQRSGGETPLFLAGYGAGGGALAYLADDPAFVSRHGNIRGIVAVESRLFSAFRSDPLPPPQVPSDARWFSRTWQLFDGLKARRVTGLGALPRPGFPTLYLVSDRALAASFGEKLLQNPYRAVWETIRAFNGPVVLAAFDGAGPLDYCDYPLTHPIYSILFPGRNKDAKKSANPIQDTVNLIGNFAVMLLEQEAANSADTPPAAPLFTIPVHQPLNGGVYIERKGLPNF